MLHRSLLRSLSVAAVAAITTAGHADVFQMPAGDTSLQFVTVGDPGNQPDPASIGYSNVFGGGLLGSVPNTFSMGKYDVTLGQYCQFLNAVAATDTYGLYDMGMNGYFGEYHFGITQSGASGSYTYAVTGMNLQSANMPVYDVTWLDAARFCNWLQNGQPNGPEGNGTTETGAYTLNGDTTVGLESRNAGATYYLPSTNEWYKAAYYVGGGPNAGYYTYPTKSYAAPDHTLIDAAINANDANWLYADIGNYLTPVGTFSASPGPYGTYDMGGDLWQLTEALDPQDSYRQLCGGSFDFDSSYLSSTEMGAIEYPSAGANGWHDGFRVASSVVVPEPGGMALIFAAVAGLCCLKCRGRQRASAK
jgi:formylglycine-generating enzyme required for sulfatase activity